MIKLLLPALLVIIPFLLVFKSFFVPGPAVFGDAPYFYSAGLNEWASQPYSWMSFGNNFGGINVFLWIYPLMFIYGALHSFLGLNNDLIIRIIFYFPATILAVIGPIFFVRFLGYGKTVQFFAALVYTFNTYFLLLVDGGQVGIALSFGIFPFTLLYLRKLIDDQNCRNFLVALLTSSLLTIADPRIALICFATLFLWVLVEMIIYQKFKLLQTLPVFILLVSILMVLHAYWIIPTIAFKQDLNLTAATFNMFSFLNPLLLFQPHWPFNEFGKISNPPLYFAAVPFLIFGILFFKRDKRIASFIIIFLCLAFLIISSSPPLGQFYNFLIANMPYGIAFRDSSKFFVPLLLFAGLLIGLLTEKLKKIFVILIYAYILFLIHPAILGQLNGVLESRIVPEDFNNIAHKLTDEESIRTVWFPDRPPFAFHSEKTQALDAKNLIWERPFASLNVGTFDHFNFLHNQNSIELFKLLGIKYLFFPGNFRKTELSALEQEDWKNLLLLVKNNPNILEEDWAVKFPIFKINDVNPRIFGVNKAVIVVGGDNVYKRFPPSNNAFLFLEDGKIDPKRLENIASASALLFFNNKEKIDLTMSFLHENFLEIDSNKFSEWAIRQSEQYLQWRYELLNRGIETSEFDFGKGVAFSDQKEEEIMFELLAPVEGEYILAARTMSYEIGDDLLATFNNGDFIINHKKADLFEWYIKEVKLFKGKHKINFKNSEGMSVLNTIALIPKEDFIKAERLSGKFLDKFSDESEIIRQNVEYEFNNPVNIKVKNISSDISWIIFTDSYNDKWENSYPFYSMVNGFYIEDSKELEIKFTGQEYVRIGWIISLTFLALLLGLALYPKVQNKVSKLWPK